MFSLCRTYFRKENNSDMQVRIKIGYIQDIYNSTKCTRLPFELARYFSVTKGTFTK